MAFLHIQKIDHLNLIAHPFQQTAAVAKQLPLTVEYKKRGIRLAQVHFTIEPALACATASAYKGIELSLIHI